MRWTSWTSVVLGIWLLIAPFVVGYHMVSAAAATEDVVMGILILGFALWTALAVAPPAGMGWAVFLFGVWVAAAPFAVGYQTVSTSAMVNDLIVGALTLLMGAIRAVSLAPAHHGMPHGQTS
jgi:SPW repeat